MLYPEDGGNAAPAAVPLKRTMREHSSEHTKFDLLSPYNLKPGKYRLLYWGQGWYDLTVYLTQLR